MYLPIIFGIIIVGLDQAVKFWLNIFRPQALVQNHGIIFGLNLPYLWLWLTFGLILLLGLMIIKKLRGTEINYLGIVLIFAGAISNILDRIIRGNIYDYLHLGSFYLNLADLAILLGLILIILNLWKSKSK